MKDIQFQSYRVLLILMLGLLSGCWFTQKGSTGNDFGAVELMASGVHGSRTFKESSATWITSPTALEQVYSSLNKHQMGNNTPLPDIDFDTHGALLLEMGQRPTGGYSIHFNPSLSRVVDQQAIIHVTWKTPADGMVVSQVLSSPYILLVITKADIASILVFDQDNQPLFQLSVP
jgi:protease stability complex PrcB-like protein